MASNDLLRTKRLVFEKLISAGVTLDTIAEITGISKFKIRNYAKMNSIFTRASGRPKKDEKYYKMLNDIVNSDDFIIAFGKVRK